MNTAVPTLIVTTENGPVVINATDFDPSLHTMADGQIPPWGKVQKTDEPAQIASLTLDAPDLDALRKAWREEIRPEIEAELRAVLEPEIRAAILAEMAAADAAAGLIAPSGDGDVSDAAKAAAAIMAPPAAPGETLLVVSKGKKHIVVGADGKPVERAGIESKGYDTEQAAWDAILAAGKQ